MCGRESDECARVPSTNEDALAKGLSRPGKVDGTNMTVDDLSIFTSISRTSSFPAEPHQLFKDIERLKAEGLSSKDARRQARFNYYHNRQKSGPSKSVDEKSQANRKSPNIEKLADTHLEDVGADIYGNEAEYCDRNSDAAGRPVTPPAPPPQRTTSALGPVRSKGFGRSGPRVGSTTLRSKNHRRYPYNKPKTLASRTPRQ